MILLVFLSKNDVINWKNPVLVPTPRYGSMKKITGAINEPVPPEEGWKRGTGRKLATDEHR
jgi:hypothetical protein